MLGQSARLFGIGRYFWDAIREINPSEVRTELERPVNVAMFGRSGSGRHTLARAIFGSDHGGTDRNERPGHGVTFNDIDVAAVAAAGLPDVAMLVLDATEPDWSAERRIAAQLAGLGCPAFLILTHSDLLPTVEQGRRALRAQFPAHPPELTAVVDPRQEGPTRLILLRMLLQAAPQLRLALGHRFPALRDSIATDLIREASRVNAQFALMSSLPALIPVLGFVIGGVADILVMTKNQAMLVFKLAGLYGRNIDDRVAVLREILPVIGGAFLWRTVARTAVGLAPAPLSALPKAAVAYLGTYAVGEAARYYYEHGDKPPPEVIAQIRAEAARRYVEVNEALKGRLGFGKRPALPPPPVPDTGGSS